MALTTPRTGFQMPASSEVDEFTDQVDEACRLIAGLQTGAISPEAFDRTERSKAEAKAAKQAKEAQEASKQAAAAQPQADPEKQEQLKQKVADLQRNRQRKEQARQRFDAYIAHKKATHETDYTKWDLFTPEDEEDDLINSLTPNNPQMKALEADIDARHARLAGKSVILAMPLLWYWTQLGCSLQDGKSASASRKAEGARQYFVCSRPIHSCLPVL